MIERGEATLAFLQERFHTVFLFPVIPCDETIDGVCYLQHPLAYPQERRGREYILAQIV